MHETAIVEQLRRQAEAKAGGRTIKGVKLECGELAHLPAKDLKKAAEAMTGWKVEVKETRSKVKCQICAFEGKPKILEKSHGGTLFACPICGSPSPEVVEGADIVLVKVECE